MSLEQKRTEARERARKQFECLHPVREVRARTIRGGGVQFVYQCVRCGEPISQPIARSEALRINNGKKPAPFDHDLLESWRRKFSEAIAKVDEEINGKWWSGYNQYLKSPEWAARREKVLNRAGGMCEGCLERRATQVHHLTYKHVGREPLFDLVAICDECHDMVHEDEEE